MPNTTQLGTLAIKCACCTPAKLSCKSQAYWCQVLTKDILSRFRQDLCPPLKSK